MSLAAQYIMLRYIDLYQRFAFLIATGFSCLLIGAIAFNSNLLLEVSPPLAALIGSAIVLFLREHRSLQQGNQTLASNQAQMIEQAVVLYLEHQSPSNLTQQPWEELTPLIDQYAGQIGTVNAISAEVFWPLANTSLYQASKEAHLLLTALQQACSEKQIYGIICSGPTRFINHPKRTGTYLTGALQQNCLVAMQTARQLNATLVFDESVYTVLKQKVDSIPVNQYRLKADQPAIRFYRPLSFSEQKSRSTSGIDLASIWREALTHYQQREWQTVIDLVRMLPNSPEKRRITASCEHFLSQPPDQDWDGSLFTHDL